MKDIGALGEQLTSNWLACQNYELLGQNWHCRWGEIDIIAQDKASKTIAFVEVKTRSQNNWDEGGLLAVNFTKQQKIIQTASAFLVKYPHLADFPCRFDVALISYLVHQEQDTQKHQINTKLMDLDLGRSVIFGKYRLTIEDYLQSAFEA